MKTQRELNQKYWNEIHDMVIAYNEKHGCDVKPWECVKGDIGVFGEDPSFKPNECRPQDYKFAVAILFDDQAGIHKPAFPGDTVYLIEGGRSLTIKDDTQECIKSEYWSWHKPQPKRTFVINGEVFPCPEEEGAFVMTLYGAGRARFKFNDSQAYEKVYDALVNMLTEARDK